MEILDDMLNIAFQSGDLSIFLVASTFIGLATGRFSALWLAVLFAVGLDIAIPGLVEMLDGGSTHSAQMEAMGRIAEQGGSGILLRAVCYFGSISSVILLKKSLGDL